jgi:hypothetical protein
MPEQDHHSADVHEHLRDGDELRRGEDVLGGDAGKDEDQPEGGVDDVVGRDDADGGDQHHGGNDVEPDVLGHVDIVGSLGQQRQTHDYFFFSAPASSSGASGTVSIHSPSFVLSCSRSAMCGSEYSYSGLQNKASNGHTSTQIPQYMHSA